MFNPSELQEQLMTSGPSLAASTEEADNDPSTIVDLGVLTGDLTLQGDVGGADIVDFFKFTLSQNSDISLLLNGLSANADVAVYDSNGNSLGYSYNPGTAEDGLSGTLTAGTYYIGVFPGGPSEITNYTLTLDGPGTTPPPTGEDPGNTLGDAATQNSAIFSQNQQVGASDSDDFYRFTVDQSGVFTADLTGLNGDADVRLIQDANSNGQIDQGEVRAWQWERGTGSESIRSFLESGYYFLQVENYNNQTANYSVATNFTAAAGDAQDFSIEINFGQGSEGLSNEMKNAVVEAADLWEGVISHSSFDSSHTLTIDVGGTVQEWTPGGRQILASAGPRDGGYDAAGRWMPTLGISNINVNPDAVAALSSDIDFFRGVMAHEFGHVLGLVGTLGSQSEFVDPAAGTYDANTYAGWAYGELLGTYEQTDIPLTTGIGPGSDLSHWSENVFDNELMTHAAGGQREGMPLSQMTIAALRDAGWNVNYGAAESYSMPDSSSSSSNSLASGSSSSLSNASCGCGLCGCGSDILSPRLADMAGIQETALI